MLRNRQKRYASSKSELARLIGVSNDTIHKLFKIPGHPTAHGDGSARWDSHEWKKFHAVHRSAHNAKVNIASGNGANGSNGFQLGPREKSIIEKNELWAAREQFKLQRDMGQCALLSELAKSLDTKLGLVHRELYKAFEQELPPHLEGVTAIQARKVLVAKLEAVLAQLPKRL